MDSANTTGVRKAQMKTGRRRSGKYGPGRPAGRKKTAAMSFRFLPETAKAIVWLSCRHDISQVRVIERAVEFAANHKDFVA